MPAEGRLLTIHCSGPEPILPSAEAPSALQRDGVDMYFATLDGHRTRIPEYGELLDPVEQERAARFRFEVDRERFIIAHGLLRTLLGKHLGRPPEKLRIARGPYGKPYIEGTELRFNLSDTKDALLIAFAHGREIGVDIETMTRTVDHMAVGEHYFTAEEIALIKAASESPMPFQVSTRSVDPVLRRSLGEGGSGRQAPGADDGYAAKRRFLEFWTRKEAVLKASGVGIMDDLRVLRVDGAVNTMTIQHEAFVQHAAEVYQVYTWMLGTDHIISLAVEGPLAGARLTTLDV